MCPTKLYSHNIQFFLNDNEQSFYWAGFLAADGCILTKKIKEVEYLGPLRLSLSYKDKDHVELFRNHINYTGPIKNGVIVVKNPKWNDSHYVSLAINSPSYYRDLSRFNIVPRKTHIYTFPRWLINHPLVNHFMRGYFDGDGCIRLDKKGNKRFELRGTHSFLNDYRSILIKQCNIKMNDIKQSGGIARLRYNGNGICNSIYSFLYKDAIIFLNRKKIIFELDNIIYEKCETKYINSN